MGLERDSASEPSLASPLPAPTSAQAVAIHEAAPSRGLAPTVLLVEDDPRMRRYLRNTLGITACG
jgi:hypothetical protein